MLWGEMIVGMGAPEVESLELTRSIGGVVGGVGIGRAPSPVGREELVDSWNPPGSVLPPPAADVCPLFTRVKKFLSSSRPV